MRISRTTSSEFEVRTLCCPPKLLRFRVSQAAKRAMDRALKPYGQTLSFLFYLQSLTGSAVSPWAFVCLTREYALAKHVAITRPSGGGLLSEAYTFPPPGDFPRVGMIGVPHKTGLKRAASRSPIFGAVWQALKHRDAGRHWLVVLDPSPEEWLKTALPGDAERWLSSPPADPETVAER